MINGISSSTRSRSMNQNENETELRFFASQRYRSQADCATSLLLAGASHVACRRYPRAILVGQVLGTWVAAASNKI